ncbi:MAG: ABC transporter ATP-binding protein [Planctomycetota bacterium]
MTAAILLEGVQKAFAGKTALSRLDLHVPRGAMAGFVGPNGAGKSTGLRILVGLLRRDGGRAEVLGLDPDRAALAIRRRTCYLPGETNVYHHLTGAEFLEFALSFYPRRLDDVADELTATWELPLARKVRTYSAGMKQKLALMATLLPDVDLYILDEPDRALDATARLFLREVLHRLNLRGKTILLSSHHLAEVEALTSQLTFVIGGASVPGDRIEAARAALRHVVRIRLRRSDASLPAGVRTRSVEADGTLRLEVEGDAFSWLHAIDPKDLDSAELGATRLEDLYQQLTMELAE